MRVAVLADVHGNLPALRAALAEIDRGPVDAIVVAGDVVGGPLPRECLELLSARPERVHWIRGNSEREAVNVYDGEPRADGPAGEPPLGARTHSIDAGATHSPAGRSRSPSTAFASVTARRAATTRSSPAPLRPMSWPTRCRPSPSGWSSADIPSAVHSCGPETVDLCKCGQRRAALRRTAGGILDAGRRWCAGATRDAVRRGPRSPRAENGRPRL